MPEKNRKIRVLFLCTGNSCRSQMAEGWARKLRNKDLEAFSAGTAAQGVNPLAVKVMAEAGVDISGQRSKNLDELSGREFDLLVTVCDQANESCPFFPGAAKRIHAAFPDPPRLARDARSEAEALVHYRRVRDQIRDFVAGMPAELDKTE